MTVDLQNTHIHVSFVSYSNSFIGSVRGSPNVTIGNSTNGTIGSQWHHWLTNGTNSTTGRANGTIGITIGTNGITNVTIVITLNDIGIPLVPLVEP